MAYKGNALLDGTTGRISTGHTLVAKCSDSATFRAPTGATGIFHTFGFFEAPVADANLNQGSATQALGSANNGYGAHAFVVASGAGSASGGSGAVTLTVTGTSITHAGVRAAADSETLIADVTAAVANKYVESTKYWIGAVTFTIDPGATGHTAYALDFNYGFSKKWDFWDQSVTITDFMMGGRAGGNDSGFDIELLIVKPNATDWTYSADAFVPGPAASCKWSTDYNTEKNLVSGKRFHYQRDGLSLACDGSIHQGIVCRITTGANNAVESSDIRVCYSLA